MTVLHKHHIIPRHMGGTDDPSNLVELTVEEHAEAHRKLWEEYGHWEDRLAWQGLLGIIPKAELIAERNRMVNLGRVSPWKGRTPTEETREKMRMAKLGRKFGKRKPYNITKKGESHMSTGKPWSAARRAAQQLRVEG